MSQYVARIGPILNTPLRKFCYNWSGFNKLGLLHNDCLYEDAIVKEAIKRLPTKLYDERNFRTARAIHLSMCHRILPKDQWTKFEEDEKYLEPYIEEVEREVAEKEAWKANH